MNNFGALDNRINHQLELYTDHLLIQGTVPAGFKRTTDLLNRGDTEFIVVQKALITPLGQPPSTQTLDSEVMVARSRLHFVVEMPKDDPSSGAEEGDTPTNSRPLIRDAYVQKYNYPCFAITGTYAIYGYCHLHAETSLDGLLRGLDVFIPITRATIYMVAHSNISWQRELVVVNRKMLSAMYLIENAGDKGGRE